MRTFQERLERLEVAILESFNQVRIAHRTYKNPSEEFSKAIARRSALLDAYAIVTNRERDDVAEEFGDRWIASIGG